MTANVERRTERRPPREARHDGRIAALQMLYQWEVGRLPIGSVRESFWTQRESEGTPSDEVQRFAGELADGVVADLAELDPLIAEAAEHWRLERMNVLDRLVLRLAVYEFLRRPDTPAKVIINEALELARAFSGDESVRFINGVLDAIRRTLQRT